MKRALVIVAVVCAFVAGVAAHSAFAIYRSPMPEVPAVGAISLAYRDPRSVTSRYVVVTIPNNTEFFIGKNRLALTDIPNRIAQQIGDLPPEQRTVFVKGEPGVTFETLSAAMRTIRDADVYRIEVVPIPKYALR
jgi:biopolymer transport protein ExbD